MSTNNLDHAYSVLVESVRAFHLAGRPCRGARLKPEFLKRLGGGATERTLGFRRFGDFLRAAQASGHIRLTPHPGGDLELALPSFVPLAWQLPLSDTLLPSSIPPPPQLPNDLNAGAVRVRPDLWRAFNAASGDWLYSVEQDVAFRGNVRNSLFSGKLVQIPSARERAVEWMEAFSHLQAPDIKTTLISALDESDNVFRFESALRSKPGLLRAWRRFHVQQLLSEIDAWSSANKVNPKDIWVPYKSANAHAPLAMAQQSAESLAPAVPNSSTQVETPRPIEQHLELRIPELIDDLMQQLIILRGTLAIARRGSTSREG